MYEATAEVLASKGSRSAFQPGRATRHSSDAEWHPYLVKLSPRKYFIPREHGGDSKDDTSISAFGNVGHQVALVAASAVVFMTVYEIIEVLLFPWIKPWESHVIIVATGAIAAATAFLGFRQNERLCRSEQSYRRLVELSPDALLVHRRGQIVFANQACAAIFAASSASELVGTPMLDRVHPDDRAAVQEKLERWEGNLGAPSLRTERKYVSLDGKKIEVESMVRPVVYQGHASTQVIFRDISERKAAERELRESEARFHTAFNVNPEPILINTLSEGRYVDVNESFLRVTGYTRKDVIGHTAWETRLWKRPEDRARYLQTLAQDGSVRDLGIAFQTKSGALRAGLVSAELIDIAGERCAIAVIKDITERKRLEVNLCQAQKMEAIGRLSGGIAHDFNNLLGVILGYSEVLETELDFGGKLHQNAQQIKKAGQRAASLTGQLLAFSRQQVLAPAVLDLNTIVGDTEKMLRRLIGENIELRVLLSPELGRVRADQGQVEQIIVNLSINARDAMPRGGILTIETANVEADDGYASQHSSMSAGSYILLSVTDTGIGMNAETQARIFEPFFTTKGPGQGTGLGLATVYGVVKQSGGFVWVRSEPGHGTTFDILLPRVEEPVATVAPLVRPAESWRGSETVLLVEDESPLRELILQMLEQDGYSVFDAANAIQAIEIAHRACGKIDLLLTDVVMPGMNGSELADHLLSLYPQIRTLYMTGYTELAVPLSDILQQKRPLLQKPFTHEMLARKVREVLENRCSPVTRSR